MNVVIYTRVSTDEQADKGFSLAHQLEVLNNYSRVKNFHVIKHFQEDYSAKTFNRPAWTKLEEFISANRKSIDLVLFTRWDRFSRNAPEAYRVLAKFRKLGVGINSIEQPLDIENPDSKIMLAFYLAIPEVENDKISLRVTEGMRKAAKDGYFVYRVPFGYKRCRINGKASIEPHPEEAPVVRWIFEQYETGLISQRELTIAIKRRFNKKIPLSSLVLLLKRETYMGMIRISAYRKEPTQLVKGLFEPIISESTFNRVQDILKGKSPAAIFRKDANSDFPLRGHVICPSCGRNLTGSRSKGRNAYHYYYHCQTPCKTRYRKAHMHDAMKTFLQSISIPEEQITLFKILIERELEQTRKDNHKLIAKHMKEIGEVEALIESAEERVFTGELSEELYNRMSAKHQQRIAFLNSEVEYLQNDYSAIDEYIESVSDLLSKLDQYFDKADFDTKSKLLGSIFPENLIFEDGEYRTAELSPLIMAIQHGMPVFNEIYSQKKAHSKNAPSWVGPPGLEPGTF